MDKNNDITINDEIMINNAPLEQNDYTINDYMNLYKQYIDKQNDIHNLHQTLNNKDKEIKQLKSAISEEEQSHKNSQDTIFNISVATVCIVAFIFFCIGSCVNGCAEDEEHYVYAPFVVKSVSDKGNNTKIINLGNHVNLVGNTSNITAGDTLIIGK